MQDAPCEATTRDGKPCSGRRLPGSAFCVFHEPTRREQVNRGRREGGKGRSTTARARAALPEDLRDVGDWLLQAMGAVRAGRMEPAQANSIANLARSYVAIHEAGAAESRLSRIEEMVMEDVG